MQCNVLKLVSIVTLSLSIGAQSRDFSGYKPSCEFLSQGNFNYNELGYYRITTASPVVSLGNPLINAQRLVEEAERAAQQGSMLFMTAELALTGYTAEDLLHNDRVLDEVIQGIRLLMNASQSKPRMTYVIGAPYQHPSGVLYNAAYVIKAGVLKGVVPKTFPPNYREFYEERWFTSGARTEELVFDPRLGSFRLSPKQVFSIGEMTFAIEICEDLFVPHSPSIDHALNGALVILNLSGSNELVGKADFRRDLIAQKAASLNVAYVYASSGPGESTKDMVLGGHHIANENGSQLIETKRFQRTAQRMIVDIDVKKLKLERRVNTSFGKSAQLFADSKAYGPIQVLDDPAEKAELMLTDLMRDYMRNPFVPNSDSFPDRAEEILEIQAQGLATALTAAGSKKMVIGVSGGLDSTWALLVAVRTTEILGWNRSQIDAVTMPASGTSKGTLASAHALASHLGLTMAEINIEPTIQARVAIAGVNPHQAENDPARERTLMLMRRGFVVGTGTMSELWKGWCTFNADQQAMYNVNAGLPKTLVQHLVKWYATSVATPEFGAELEAIVARKMSAELKPLAADGSMTHITEDEIGPYLLNDYFMWAHLRGGFGPTKILELAWLTFGKEFEAYEIAHWLKDFYARGYRSQYKRTDMPAGPKIGNVSVSPRADLRMPNEVDPKPTLEIINQHYVRRTGKNLVELETQFFKHGPIK